MRDQIVRCRVSSAEIVKMKDLATARGVSLSDLIRRAALGVRLPSVKMDRTEIVLLTQVLGHLGRIGGNINQLSRRANSGKLSGHDAELTDTLVGINALRDRLREIIA
ncbi:plasmid mobilization relaxosome protein MobC [uncultured Hoeflea sp.]|uniref:plasmid mobilization protein n=1 Tax=uncultured Hoeflea sp. TaxID=538666 RepID=UPI0030EF87E5